MTKIIFRILFVLALFINALIITISMITGVNIYEKYGKELLIATSVFFMMLTAFYMALALLGID